MTLQSITTIHKFFLQVPTTTKGIVGGVARAWNDSGTEKDGRFRPLSGSERLTLFKQRHHEVDTVLYLSVDPGITTETASGYRIRRSDARGLDRVFQIKEVRNVDELDRLWQVYAVESSHDALVEP